MLMILQKFGQCPLVFTLFGKRSDYELLDVSLKSWKKKTTFCVISAWRRTKMHVLGLYGFFFWIDWPKVKDSWRKHFDACKSLATFIKCYVDRTTLSCPQIYIYIPCCDEVIYEEESHFATLEVPTSVRCYCCVSLLPRFTTGRKNV